MGQGGGGTEARKKQQVASNDQGKRNGYSGASCLAQKVLPCESWSQAGLSLSVALGSRQRPEEEAVRTKPADRTHLLGESHLPPSLPSGFLDAETPSATKLQILVSLMSPYQKIIIVKHLKTTKE